MAYKLPVVTEETMRVIFEQLRDEGESATEIIDTALDDMQRENFNLYALLSGMTNGLSEDESYARVSMAAMIYAALQAQLASDEVVGRL